MDPFLEEIERQAREAAQQKTAEAYKYNPRIASKPGEALEVTVDVPDGAGPDVMIEAMEEAARKAGLL